MGQPIPRVDVDAMAAVLADPEVLRLTGSVHTLREEQGVPPPAGGRGPSLSAREWGV